MLLLFGWSFTARPVGVGRGRSVQGLGGAEERFCAASPTGAPLGTAHRRRTKSVPFMNSLPCDVPPPADSTRLPSGEKRAVHTQERWPTKRCRSLPLSRSHRRTVQS